MLCIGQPGNDPCGYEFRRGHYDVLRGDGMKRAAGDVCDVHFGFLLSDRHNGSVRDHLLAVF